MQFLFIWYSLNYVSQTNSRQHILADEQVLLNPRVGGAISGQKVSKQVGYGIRDRSTFWPLLAVPLQKYLDTLMEPRGNSNRLESLTLKGPRDSSCHPHPLPLPLLSLFAQCISNHIFVSVAVSVSFPSLDASTQDNQLVAFGFFVIKHTYGVT